MSPPRIVLPQTPVVHAQSAPPQDIWTGPSVQSSASTFSWSGGTPQGPFLAEAPFMEIDDGALWSSDLPSSPSDEARLGADRRHVRDSPDWHQRRITQNEAHRINSRRERHLLQRLAKIHAQTNDQVQGTSASGSRSPFSHATEHAIAVQLEVENLAAQHRERFVNPDAIIDGDEAEWLDSLDEGPGSDANGVPDEFSPVSSELRRRCPLCDGRYVPRGDALVCDRCHWVFRWDVLREADSRFHEHWSTIKDNVIHEPFLVPDMGCIRVECTECPYEDVMLRG